jgi:TorA maturation chaperone TorD
MVHQRERVSEHKNVLFNTKKVEFLDEKQEEAKLMKILTVLQQHLARDKKTKDYQEVFASSFKDAQEAHRAAITKALEKLKGNKVRA